MKKYFLPLVLSLGVFLLYSGCSKEPVAQNDVVSNNVISKDVIAAFQAKGFNTDFMEKHGDKYLVEGCTMVGLNELPNMIETVGEPGPSGEQYRTTNLVSKPTVIKVKGPTSPAKMNTAVDQAIAKYNAMGLQITFTRVTSGANITITCPTSSSAGGYSGFPSGGKPYSSVVVYSGTTTYSQAVVTHVVTHEIGHCIGFRHSDYFNRSLSCGTGGNEGASTVGAIYIPGTATGFDAGSVMNSCFSTSSTGNFSSYDKTALNYLYK